jgi:hypothetical protein
LVIGNQDNINHNAAVFFFKNDRSRARARHDASKLAADIPATARYQAVFEASISWGATSRRRCFDAFEVVEQGEGAQIDRRRVPG